MGRIVEVDSNYFAVVVNAHEVVVGIAYTQEELKAIIDKQEAEHPNEADGHFFIIEATIAPN